MCPVTLTVWFLCKSCKLNFAKVDDYIDHKKENHFTEFQLQNMSCIVFEERIDGGCDNESGLMEATPILLKEEFQLVSDSRVETTSDPNIVSCVDDQNLTWQIADLTAQTSDFYYEDLGPMPDILMLNTEFQSQEENTSEIGSFPPKQNPYVLLKRLTSQEIQDASTAANLELNWNKHPTSRFVRRPFKCTRFNCGKAFKSKKYLGTHMKCHSELRPFGCPQCDKTFTFRHLLVWHLRLHTGERPFKCSFDNCGETFAQSKTLWYHKRNVHCNTSSQNKPFQCTQLNCGKAFKCKSDLMRHMRGHSDLKPFGCTQCDKAFKLRQHLLEHVRVHTGERPYKCPVDNCGKSFAKSTTMCRHKRECIVKSHLKTNQWKGTSTTDSPIETTDESSFVSCFVDPKLPLQIAGVSAQTNYYICDDSQSPTKAILEPKTELVTYESQIQEAETNLVGSFQAEHNPCIFLKKQTFSEILSEAASSATNRQLNLNKNLTSHNLRRSFKCKNLFCGKAFKSEANLNLHIKSHLGLRPFGCSQCGKTFKRRGHLVEHVRMHTGERPYKCTIDNCNKTFASSSNFNTHKINVHRIGERKIASAMLNQV